MCPFSVLKLQNRWQTIRNTDTPCSFGPHHGILWHLYAPTAHGTLGQDQTLFPTVSDQSGAFDHINAKHTNFSKSQVKKHRNPGQCSVLSSSAHNKSLQNAQKRFHVNSPTRYFVAHSEEGILILVFVWERARI